MSDSNSNSTQKANLARIRDNQRRSRARRKEYLQELEAKYRTCEAVGVEASAEIQAAARRVLEENRRLRQLLKQQGLSDAEIDGFTPMDEGNVAHSPNGSMCSDNSPIENPQFPTASGQLDRMLTNKKICRPSDDGSGCKSENSEPTAQSIAACMPLQNQQQSIAPCMPLQSQQQRMPLLSPSQTQQQQQQNQQQQQQQQQQSQAHAGSQPSLQSRSRSITSIPQSQVVGHYPQPMNTPSHSHTHSLSHSPQPSAYAMYEQQAHANFMYHQLSMDNLSTWNLSPAGQQALPGSQQQLHHQQGQQHQHQYSNINAPPTMDLNTSSCYVAADAIRSLSANAGPEVEAALGCRPDGSDCNVRNDVVFDLMDRYEGVGAGMGGDMGRGHGGYP